MKYDLMRMVGESQQHEKSVKGLNLSFIVLLPKKEATNVMNDFRPISLIGSIYKIISKVMARRLSKVLDSFMVE